MGRNRSAERRAVFLDRDGVINRNVLNPATGEFEAPLTPADFEFVPGALSAMQKLQAAGYLLFLVSNQPNFAKGKSSLHVLKAIHGRLVEGLTRRGIEFARFYYCFHHPGGDGNRYARFCLCRKPSPHFLLKAAAQFRIELRGSWMIGDRLTDVECGKFAGAKTVLIAEPPALGSVEPDAIVPDLSAAARLILLRG
ncbi:MAG: HAD family hydrolase [Silvibacterium sp.]|nr:HAD family hydrolase [Silvibacterium sp.]